MKYRLHIRRSGGQLFLFQIGWAVLTALTFGFAGLFWPVALVCYLVDHTELQLVDEVQE
jgi:hypothetical protein